MGVIAGRSIRAATPSPDSRPAKRRRRRRRVAILALIVLIILATFGVLGAAWYFSNQVLEVSHAPGQFTFRVLGQSGSTVTLTRTIETARNGIFGIDYVPACAPGEGCPARRHAMVGRTISSSPTRVVRQLIGSHPQLGTGDRAGLDAYTYTSPAVVHIRYNSVVVSGPLGLMPAWFVPALGRTWVITVHGYNSIRAESVRPMPVLTSLHLPVLDISYRNDSDAPASPDHLYHLGDTEWLDLQASVRFALAHGARSVVLYGYSMGGGVVEDFMHRSPLASKVKAVVLDSPALDWYSILNLAAAQRGLPGFFAALVEKVVALRLGMPSLDRIDALKTTGGPAPPLLLFHGTQDTTVPISGSDQFARQYRGAITYYRVPGADHTQPWNVGPALYDHRLRAFLSRIVSR